MNKKEKQELDDLDEFLELVGTRKKKETTLEELLKGVNEALARVPSRMPLKRRWTKDKLKKTLNRQKNLYDTYKKETP